MERSSQGEPDEPCKATLPSGSCPPRTTPLEHRFPSRDWFPHPRAVRLPHTSERALLGPWPCFLLPPAAALEHNLPCSRPCTCAAPCFPPSVHSVAGNKRAVYVPGVFTILRALDLVLYDLRVRSVMR